MARKQSASSKSFGGILAVVAIAGVAAIGYVVSRPAKVTTLETTLPPVEASGIRMGDSMALVQIVEFADFECPGCGQFATVTEPDIRARLIETGEVGFVFMDLPLDGHRNSPAAHNAARCADEQGKFWPMHDGIFLRQHEWNSQSTRTPKKVLAEIARSVGLDMKQWDDCFDSERMLPQIAANRAEATRLRIRGTPSFIINGRLIETGGVPTYDQMRVLITEAKVRALAERSEASQAAGAAKKTP